MSTFTEIVADLTFQQRAIALFLVVNGPQTLTDLAPRFSRHRSTVWRWIEPMVARGLISKKDVKGSYAKPQVEYTWIGGQA